MNKFKILKNLEKINSKLIPVLGLILFFNSSAATATDFFNSTLGTTAPLTNQQLNNLFTKGEAPSSASSSWGSATSPGNGFRYNFPINGIPGTNYNGCYDSKNRRLGDLPLSEICLPLPAPRDNESVYGLTVGARLQCFKTDATGNCTDTAIILNCRYRQDVIGTTPGDVGGNTTTLCQSLGGMVRRAKTAAVEVPPIGCDYGQYMTATSTCAPCPSGTYKKNFNSDTSCRPCTDKVLAHVAIQPTTYSTTLTSTIGAISPEECRVSPTDPWTCVAGWEKEPGNQYCIRTCTLSFNIDATGPSSATNQNGKLVLGWGNALGTVSNFQVSGGTLSSAVNLANPTTLDTPAFTLGVGTYTVSARDYEVSTQTTCNKSSKVTLVPRPPCTLAAGTVTTNNPTNPPTNNNGSSTVNFSGANGTVTSTISPAGPTVSVGGTSVSYGGLSVGNYIATLKDDLCSTSAAVTVKAPCALSLATGTITNPSSAAATDGSIVVNASGGLGPLAVTYTRTPVLGALAPASGNTTTLSGVGVGAYTIVASDPNIPGCTASQVATLTFIGPSPPPSTGCIFTRNVVRASGPAATDGQFDVYIGTSVTTLPAFYGAFTVSMTTPYTGPNLPFSLAAGFFMSGWNTITGVGSAVNNIQVTGTCNENTNVDTTAIVAPVPICGALAGNGSMVETLSCGAGSCTLTYMEPSIAGQCSDIDQRANIGGQMVGAPCGGGKSCVQFPRVATGVPGQYSCQVRCMVPPPVGLADGAFCMISGTFGGVGDCSTCTNAPPPSGTTKTEIACDATNRITTCGPVTGSDTGANCTSNKPGGCGPSAPGPALGSCYDY